MSICHNTWRLGAEMASYVLLSKRPYAMVRDRGIILQGHLHANNVLDKHDSGIHHIISPDT
jgi:hypothetical protein